MDICSSPQMTPNKKSNSYAFSVGSCTSLFLSFFFLSKIHYIVRYDNVHLKAGWENQVSLTEAR